MSKGNSSIVRKYGWIRDSETDVSPHRRYSALHLQALASLPEAVDLRKKFPPVYDQGTLGSCSGIAIATAIEFQNMKSGQNPAVMLSPLFIYYNERKIENMVNSDSGAMIITGMKSVNTQGACPESMWPYDIAKYKIKPPKQCYKTALDNKVTSYYKVTQDLNQMQGCLASGYPFVLGIEIYSSFTSDKVGRTGKVPMPKKSDSHLGGHAVIAAGYDNSKKCFILRNSWGESWGEKGYFMLPYKYALDPKLSASFWTIRGTSSVIHSLSSNMSASKTIDSSAVVASVEPSKDNSLVASLPMNTKSSLKRKQSSSFVERLEEEKNSSVQEKKQKVASSR